MRPNSSRGCACGLLHGPLRQQRCMDHRMTALDVKHRPHAQPRDEFGRIGSLQHVAEGVGLAPALDPLELGDQMQVMVAEDRDRPLSERAHATVRSERGGVDPSVA